MSKHMGTRIAMFRCRRGMSQQALAGLAGVSQPYVSQVEAGLREIDRRSTLVAFANALQVSVPDLTGQPGEPVNPAHARALAAVPAIRTMLLDLREGERPPVSDKPVEALRAELATLAEERLHCDYAAYVPKLPGLLRDTAHHPRLLVLVAYLTYSCLRVLGHRDLAIFAAELAVAAAEDDENWPWLAAARYAKMQARPVEGATVTHKVAERHLGELERHLDDSAVRRSAGMLHLVAGLAHATDSNEDAARVHLNEAESIAATVSEDADARAVREMCFGPMNRANIRLWHMSFANEFGEHGRVLELARDIDLSSLRFADRSAAYYEDLGRAWAATGRNDIEALGAFLESERAAPQYFRLRPIVHETVGGMIRRARRKSVADDLRGMATRLGVYIGGD